MTPDENRDVVVHAFTLVDALTGDPIGKRWSVWLGRESQGSYDSEGAALDTARTIAEERDLPAWLVRDDGGISSIALAWE